MKKYYSIVWLFFILLRVISSPVFASSCAVSNQQVCNMPCCEPTCCDEENTASHSTKHNCPMFEVQHDPFLLTSVEYPAEFGCLEDVFVNVIPEISAIDVVPTRTHEIQQLDYSHPPNKAPPLS